jgi:peptidylprolyl isomerase/peptidyl-prolyl cis-trans isomerase D
MAVLAKIRQRSLFLILIIALALFAFILSDILSRGGFSQSNPTSIGSVNGTDIEAQSFRVKVDNAERNLGANATTGQAVKYVWDQEVGKIVYNEQFEKLGIRVEQDEIWTMLVNSLSSNPNFQNENGFFDEFILREYISGLKEEGGELWTQWVEYENSLASNAAQQHYHNLVKSGLGTTKLEGRWAYANEEALVDFDYVYVPYTTIADDQAEVSKEEIAAYIKKNPSQFKVDESRAIRFVLFEENPSLEDEEAAKQEIAGLIKNRVEFNPNTQQNDTVKGLAETEDVAAYLGSYSDIPYRDVYTSRNQLSGEFADSLFNTPVGGVFGPYKEGNLYKATRVVAQTSLPDSVKASHILISYQGLQFADATALPKSQAKSLADSLLTVIKNNPSQFDALAKEYSLDQSNKDKGGDLGYFTQGTMVPAFNDYAFQNKKGDIGVVETQFGFHIVKIDDQKGSSPVKKFATVARGISPSEKTLSDLFTDATKFEMAVKNGDFQEIAQESNYQVRPINNIGKLDEFLPGLGVNRALVQWIYNEETKVADIRRFDLSNGDYAVVQLTAKIKEGLSTPENASARVLPILRNEKKAAIIRQKLDGKGLEEATASFENVSIQSALAVSRQNPTIPGAGREPKVVGAVFGLAQGASATVDGNLGVYVVQNKNATTPQELPSYAAYTANLLSQRTAAVAGNVFNVLKEKAEIEDNRIVFY